MTDNQTQLQQDYFVSTDSIEIAIERQVYSVIEGDEVEVCIVVLAGAVLSGFEINASLDTECEFCECNK